MSPEVVTLSRHIERRPFMPRTDSTAAAETKKVSLNSPGMFEAATADVVAIRDRVHAIQKRLDTLAKRLIGEPVYTPSSGSDSKCDTAAVSTLKATIASLGAAVDDLNPALDTLERL